jgi:hypothetical protein
VLPGPAWSGALAREAAWGTWLHVPRGGLVAVELRWSHGAGPTVLLATPDEQWWTPDPQPEPPLHRAWMQVPPGWTWLAIVQSYDDAVDVELATFLPVEA